MSKNDNDVPLPPVPVSTFLRGGRRRTRKLYSFRKATAAMYARDEREKQKRKRQKP